MNLLRLFFTCNTQSHTHNRYIDYVYLECKLQYNAIHLQITMQIKYIDNIKTS